MATKIVWNEFKPGDHFYLFGSNAMTEWSFVLAASDGQALCEKVSGGNKELLNLQNKNVYTKDAARFNKSVKTQLLNKNVWFKYIIVIHSDTASEGDKEEVHVEYGKVEYISINTMKCCVKGNNNKYHEIPLSYIIQNKSLILKDRN